jgi:hypothetical protein
MDEWNGWWGWRWGDTKVVFNRSLLLMRNGSYVSQIHHCQSIVNSWLLWLMGDYATWKLNNCHCWANFTLP